jgi:hypothetical protein
MGEVIVSSQPGRKINHNPFFLPTFCAYRHTELFFKLLSHAASASLNITKKPFHLRNIKTIFLNMSFHFPLNLLKVTVKFCIFILTDQFLLKLTLKDTEKYKEN